MQPKGDDWSECAKKGYSGMQKLLSTLPKSNALFVNVHLNSQGFYDLNIIM